MELEIQASQYQAYQQQANLSPMMRYRIWRDRPLSNIDDTELIKHVHAVGGAEYGSMDPLWKAVRRRILGGEPGRSVNIGIVGLSVSGKSEIAQAFSTLVKSDFYLKTELAKSGLEAVPRTRPFSLAAKAMQLPKEKGGAGIIRPDAGHGRFTEDEYGHIAAAMQEHFSSAVSNPTAGKIEVNIMEASGLPYPAKSGYPVSLEGMADRGISPIYNLADHPSQAKNSFILLVAPNAAVQEFGLTERNYNSGSMGQTSLVDGRVMYKVTAPTGMVKDVAELTPLQQADVARLLSMAMAPHLAVERSNLEFLKMKADLVDRGVISDSSNETFVASTRDRLLHRTNGQRTRIPESNVIVIENQFWAGYRNPSSNVRDLDYFLRDCVWSQEYPELIPRSLREFLNTSEGRVA